MTLKLIKFENDQNIELIKINSMLKYWIKRFASSAHHFL